MSDWRSTRLTNWLIRELSGVVPDWIKASFFGSSSARPLHFNPALTDIRISNGNVTAPCNVLTGTASPNRLKKVIVVDAFVPESLVLRRSIKVPKSALREVESIAKLDLVRRTPFSTEDVYWTLSPLEGSGEQASVRQWVAKQHDVKTWVKNMSSCGLQPRRIYVAGNQHRSPLVDLSSETNPMGRMWRRTNLALSFSAMILAAFAWLYPATVAVRETQKMDQMLVELRQQALQIRREVHTLTAEHAERAAYLELVSLRPKLADTLMELTSALSDDVWLSDLAFESDRVSFSGQTSNLAADLVLKLSDNPTFLNPRISGSVALVSGNAERFQIAAELMRAP